VLAGRPHHHVARFARALGRGGAVAQLEAGLGVGHEHDEVVGMLVHDALVAGRNARLQHADALVLGHDLVMLRVDLHGILRARGRLHQAMP
jgi:hypothetical protein